MAIAETIRLIDLKTAHDCMDAIDSIEHDRRNYSCNPKRWREGGSDVFLTSAAKRKYDAILRKLYRLPDGDEIKASGQFE